MRFIENPGDPPASISRGAPTAGVAGPRRRAIHSPLAGGQLGFANLCL